MAETKRKRKTARTLDTQKAEAAVKEVLTDFFGREQAGSELLPPEWQANVKDIFAKEQDVDKRGRLLFDVVAADAATTMMAANVAKVRAMHNGSAHDNVANWMGVNALGLKVDRTWNPDEVAQLTETNRAAQAAQIDALATLLVSKLAEVLREQD